MKNFKIIFLNVNGLNNLSKRAELDHFLNRHNPDIMLIAEHRLKKNQITFRNYKLIKQNIITSNTRPCSGFLVGIIIKNGLKYTTINTPITNHLEAIAIQIAYTDSRNNKHKLTIVSLYKRPQEPLLTSDLNKLISSIKRNAGDHPIIIGCDLNSKHPVWHSPFHSANHINTDGKTFLEWLQNDPSMTMQITPEPTRITPTTTASIDFFFNSDDVNIQENCQILKDFPSDHYAILLKVNLGNCFIEKINPTKIYNFEKINPTIYNTIVTNNIENIPNDTTINKEEIDRHIGKLQDALKKGLSSEAAIPKIIIDPTKPNQTIKINTECQQLMTLKRKLRRRLIRRQTNITSNERYLIKAIIKDITTQINKLIEKSFLQNIENKLKHLKPNKISIKTLSNTNNDRGIPNLTLTQNQKTQ